ncbi:Atg29-N domain-containing protein [Mycena venus]|uniref:Autophagy-related protein 29 n=1 Tax=Mycena venus TaxID=2733690 RepID=A0A8H7D7Q8_9AGAR|nr:Atg29-N domain-containing protein [Mycena venus]
MPTSTAPNMRVVVQLPWNRPEHPLADPPRIEWTSEKADILWKVIERSRSTDNGGTDWKGLAAHLEVPLPYLLYRVHARFQEELRGLQDIPGVSSPSTALQNKPFDEFPFNEKHTVASRAVSRLNGSGSMSPSGRLPTPLGVRARLSSLGNNSPRPKKATSSSTITVQPPKKTHRPLSPTSSASSEGTDSEDEEAKKEEEAERNAEEQEALDRKLQELQQMVTNDALGLVSAASRSGTSGKGKAKETSRGRMRPGATAASPLQGSFRRDSYSSPLSVSSASSAQSIPDIPSPPPDSQSHSPMSRHLSPSSRHPNKSSSPPALSPRSALGQSHRRYGPLVERGVGEQGSNHGSEASSFSDISDTSLSASALESALLSNIRGNGSRISAFARSRLVGRGGH